MTRSLEQLTAIASFSDALPAAIWVGRAPSGECVYVNREFERILGIVPPVGASRGNYVGPYSVHRSSGEPYPEAEMPFERVLKARALVVVDDLVIHRHDGEKTFLRVFAAPLLDERGEVTYVVEAFIDISREVESERQRIEGERHAQMVLRLESVGSVAGGIAHDFNNLLSIVKLVASNLRQRETNPVKLELISHLDDVADSATSLTRALLGFAQRGRGQLEALNLHDVVAGIAELVRRTFDRRIEVTTRLEAKTGYVRGERSALEQILLNLLVNARDAIVEQGSICIRTIDLVVHEGENPMLSAGTYVALEVSDTGTGIPTSIQSRIFEPYFTTKVGGAQRGTGLGLSTVYGLSHAHGGLVEILQTSPAGTTFRVSLPAEKAPAKAPTAPIPEPGRAIRGAGTVLLVDDEALVLKTAGLVLGDLGYEVRSADGGQHALELIASNPSELAAVVLDLNMPGLSGFATYLQLREHAPSLPVLFTSGGAVPNDVAQTLLGPERVAFLAKPYSAIQLSLMLSRLLETETPPEY